MVSSSWCGDSTSAPPGRRESVAVRPATVCTHPHNAPIGGRDSRRCPTKLARSSPTRWDADPNPVGWAARAANCSMSPSVDLFDPLCRLEKQLVDRSHLALQCVDLIVQMFDL